MPLRPRPPSDPRVKARWGEPFSGYPRSPPSKAKGVRPRTVFAGRSMVKDVPISKVTGAVVTTWRVVDHVYLLLSIRGQPEEIRLQCKCGRCHWIVREHHGDGPTKLLATCHNCGTKVEYLLEGAPLPKA